MGILKKSRDGQDLEFEDENSNSNSGRNLEKLYEKLFFKIGRDFIFREDFERIISDLIEAINPDLEIEINLFSDENAMIRAYEYREFLENDINGSDVYKDLINLSED